MGKGAGRAAADVLAEVFGGDRGKVGEQICGQASAVLPQAVDFMGDGLAVRAMVEGERLAYGHLANPAFATEVSKIDPLPHQRIAVYEHMLKQPRLRFLLADDAGAGKTIMTGLYIREMLARRLIRAFWWCRPPGLVGNWQSEMRELFGMEFAVVTGADLAARNTNPFSTGPNADRVICSVDTLRGERAFLRLSEAGVLPYDLVVFDEAHKLSARQDADLTMRRSARYELAEALAGVANRKAEWNLGWSARHLLLLTATPHMGKDYPFFALWKLLDPQTFSTIDAFQAMPRESRERFFIRRTKEEMVTFEGKPLYPKRNDGHVLLRPDARAGKRAGALRPDDGVSAIHLQPGENAEQDGGATGAWCFPAPHGEFDVCVAAVVGTAAAEAGRRD